MDLLAGQNARRVQQIPVHRDAALVVRIHAGQNGPVNLGCQHDALHKRSIIHARTPKSSRNLRHKNERLPPNGYNNVCNAPGLIVPVIFNILPFNMMHQMLARVA